MVAGNHRDTANLGDVFYFSHQGITSSSFRLAEAVPGKRVVWKIDHARLAFVEDHDEWSGTRIVFDIKPTADGTTVTFTHDGLAPTVECFEACSRGWRLCMTSLKRLIEAVRSRSGDS
ncbi:MAG: SRPBCC family protein [Mycobacteriales bacterium]